ncbi:MAG: dihydrodipicolinate synthase family protein [Bryobacterales bacterium]|nr:dihydrodipicolinate synthase family protein [Bryobacterales bacterium]
MADQEIAHTLPHGIVPVLQTPFSDTGVIDYESLTRLIEDAIASGASGFLAPAVASEVGTLSLSERSDLVPFVVRQSKGRLPLIAGCSASTADQCAEYSAIADKAGAQAILISPPDSLRAQASDLIEFFRIATAKTNLPLIVQDLDWNGEGLAIDTIERLREAIPQFQGIKIETVPAGPKYTAVRHATEGRFHISGGWAIGQMIEAMDRGVDALIPEASMVRVYHEIWRRYHSGDRASATALFRRLLPVLAFTNQEIRLSIAFFKRLLVRRGIFTSAAMRVPGFAWDEHGLRTADELIEHYLEIEASTSTC